MLVHLPLWIGPTDSWFCIRGLFDHQCLSTDNFDSRLGRSSKKQTPNTRIHIVFLFLFSDVILSVMDVDEEKY